MTTDFEREWGDSHLKTFQKKLEHQELMDGIGDMHAIPQEMPPSLRMLCAMLKKMWRIHRMAYIENYVQKYGSIDQKFIPYIKQLCELRPKDYRRLGLPQNIDQLSIFGELEDNHEN